MGLDLNNSNDRDYLKEVIEQATQPIISELNNKLNIINNDITYIKKQTTETNGKVKKHEEILSEINSNDTIHKEFHRMETNNRYYSCPHTDTINEMKNKNKIKIGVRQVIIGGLTLISLMLGIAFTTIQLNNYFSDKNTKSIINEINKNKENNDNQKN